MTRLPLALLVAALPLAVVPGRAHAQQEQEPSNDAPSSRAQGEASSTVGTVEAAPAEPKAEKEKNADTAVAQNARLAPGGLVAVAEGGFPLHISLDVTNFVGNGLLQQGDGQAQPQWGTIVSLRPFASLNAIPFLREAPRMMGSLGVSFSIANWISSYANAGVYDRIVRVSDVNLGLVLPALVKEPTTSTNLTLALSARLPLSIASRQMNLATGLGLAAPIAWMSPETAVGSFMVQYTPRLGANLYTDVAPTVPCDASAQVGADVTNPIDGVSDPLVPLYYGRPEQLAPNGECRIASRQQLFGLSNTALVSWSFGAHSLYASIGWVHAFQRPLAADPSLSSPFSSGQGFNESSNGDVGYNYALPLDVPVNLSVGISSQQPAYHLDGRLRFPLYDFVTPGNNFSSAYVSLSANL